MSKFIEVAKKLKALAERGEGGEKINAIKMLNHYCVKHDILPEELEEKTLRRREFPFDMLTRQIIVQIIFNVCDRAGSTYRDKRKKDIIFLKMTDAEFIEVEAKIAFYVPIYRKQIDLFETAFITKNNLFGSQSDDESESKMSPEDLEDLISMMGAMKTHNFAKQLKA
jgi:hypothetical protein